MALTKVQKDLLDEALVTVLRKYANNGTEFSNYDIINNINLDFDCTIQSVVASLRRILKNEEFSGYELISRKNYWDKTQRYILRKFLVSIQSAEIRKNKNLLYFDCLQGQELSYDFITKTYSKEFNYDTEVSDMYGVLRSFEKMKDVEWLFNYVDNMKTICDIERFCNKKVYEKMPKDYLKYLKETEKSFCWESLRYCYYYNLYGRAGINIINTYGIDEAELIIEKITAKNLNKMITNDIKNGIYDFEIRCFLESYEKLITTYPNLNERLDLNRGISFNERILEDIYNKQKNEILEKQLQRLNFINGMVIDNEYIVVVPQTQEEKQDEGKMQNNCVGYYYDESIRNGKNLIYFIRKNDNPNKSYITCRYNTSSKDTVEYRKYNNASVRDEKEEEMIKKISKIIREQL